MNKLRCPQCGGKCVIVALTSRWDNATPRRGCVHWWCEECGTHFRWDHGDNKPAAVNVPKAKQYNLLSTRTKVFAEIKRGLARLGFKCKCEKGFLLFVHKKFYLRLEEVDRTGRYVVAYVSPTSVFDRWANSRHFKMHIPLDLKPPMKWTVYGWLKDYLAQVFLIAKAIPEEQFNRGVRIEL